MTKISYENCINYIVSEKQKGVGSRAIAKALGGCSKSTINYYYNKWLDTNDDNKAKGSISKRAKVLVLDIETNPIIGYLWSLWQKGIGLNQVAADWYLLSFTAKWLGDPEDKYVYMDNQHYQNKEDDTPMLRVLWDLLDEADIVLTQNGKKFDIPKIKARLILKGFKPFSPVRHIDTCIIAQKTFGFTSNKLEYLTENLCTKHKKSKHKKFAGFELWSECMKGNPEAYEDMREYNIVDVLSLEELYYIIAPWSDRLPNPNLYIESLDVTCPVCGSHNMVEYGYAYTDVSKFQQYKCKDCGKHQRSRKNLLTKEKRDTILTNSREY